MHDFPASPVAGGLLAGDIFVVSGPDGGGAGYPLVLNEPEWTAADILTDLGEGVGFGDAFRHDEAAIGTQSVGHHWERPCQANLKAFVVDHFHFGGLAQQALAEAVALAPALDRSDAIA